MRSKASEELLRNSGSICVPLLALDYKHGADCLTAAKSAAGEDKMVSSVKPVDAIEREGQPFFSFLFTGYCLIQFSFKDLYE